MDMCNGNPEEMNCTLPRMIQVQVCRSSSRSCRMHACLSWGNIPLGPNGVQELFKLFFA
jgi:hypothetical protein